MYFQIIEPDRALKPYINRYVFVRAEGSTDTMTPPADDSRFVNGKHAQPLLPNYGSMVFVRNAVVERGGKNTLLVGAQCKSLEQTTAYLAFPSANRPILLHCLGHVELHTFYRSMF